jgi:hypothetical protein
MSDDIKDTIRERAYHIWRENGCHDGEASRHWLDAEREVLAAFAASAQEKARDPADPPAREVAPKPKARSAGGARRRAS